MSSKQPAPQFPAPIYAETVLNHLFTDGQQFFFEHLLHIHYAHCLMLAKQRILTRAEAAAILRGLDALDHKKIRAAKYDGTVEDLYFYVERELIEGIGEELAGKLHTARSRNDIDITLYRMKLRGDLLELIGALLGLQTELISLARQHTRTVMPAHTHTQPAQPTTLAHYLSAAIEFIGRDLTRLQAAFVTVNRNPLGACAITTTGFPINRDLTAELLGFEGLAENSYGAVAAVDYLLEAVAALAVNALNLGKFTQDLLLWATQEFSFLTLNDAYVQTSSIMPQKRNPVALEHVRILLSRAASQAQAVMTCTHNTPFGDINDSEDPLQPLVHRSFADAKRAVKLLAGAIGALEIDVAGLRQKAAESFLTMTELADTLVRAEGLGFKQAHRLTAQTAKRLPNHRAPHTLIVETLQAVALELLGRALKTAPAKLLEALSPEGFVNIRTVSGGPAPSTVTEFLDRQTQTHQQVQRWLNGQQKSLRALPLKLARAKKSFLL
ncbi:MAG: argininosuccinate lyase [Acidobacteria bacterium]|nr:argininosuccinate lyase [Acidobacteriota bacterium]MBI3427071.1 argininosuccinate lyase [Acidobacteriota bacterium]